MSLFDRLRNALRPSTESAAEPAACLAEPSLVDSADEARRATHAALDRHWQSVGSVEKDVLGYFLSPSFTGGPAWPSTRQAYRVVRRGERILLASDGLSDPFDDAEGFGNGFEMELFVETADIAPAHRGTPGDVSTLSDSWAFELLEHVAQIVADAGGITAQLEQYGALSMELPGVSQSRAIGAALPALFVTEDDALGVLLGAPKPDFNDVLDDMPLSPVRLVPIVVLTAAELEFVRAGGGQARAELLERLVAADVGHVSDLQRNSVM